MRQKTDTLPVLQGVPNGQHLFFFEISELRLTERRLSRIEQSFVWIFTRG